MTFSRACRHVTNYTAAHESPLRFDLHYPDRHIEVSPRLSWVLSEITSRYRDAMFVHLRRRKEDVVASWMRRGRHRGPGHWAPLVWHNRPGDFRRTCSLCYDAMTGSIDTTLAAAGVERMTLDLETIRQTWRAFWQRIAAEGDFQKSLAEWNLRYNAS